MQSSGGIPLVVNAAKFLKATFLFIGIYAKSMILI